MTGEKSLCEQWAHELVQMLGLSPTEPSPFTAQYQWQRPSHSDFVIQAFLNHLVDINACVVSRVKTRIPAPADSLPDVAQSELEYIAPHAKWEITNPRCGCDGFMTLPYFLRPSNNHVFPVEIGSCDGPRTLHRLWEWGGVVRWPYGVNEVVFIRQTGNVFRELTTVILNNSPLGKLFGEYK